MKFLMYYKIVTQNKTESILNRKLHLFRKKKKVMSVQIADDRI